jgi:tetratricopeptide (TPR) repeat protein
MKSRRVACGLFILLAVVSCASRDTTDDLSFETAPLFGMIYDQDNQPCAGVQLTVDGAAGPLSDIRGRFMVPALSRGRHTVSAARQGSEPLTQSFLFLDRTDVLYLRMTSFGQLLGMAQGALRDLQWGDARALLDRAAKIEPEDPLLRYLLAVYAYRTGDSERALSELGALVSRGNAQPAVYLFLADIYAKSVDGRRKAIAALDAALKLRSDPDVEKRIAELKGQADGEAVP